MASTWCARDECAHNRIRSLLRATVVRDAHSRRMNDMRRRIRAQRRRMHAQRTKEREEGVGEGEVEEGCYEGGNEEDLSVV